jgi:hypothetical protein
MSIREYIGDINSPNFSPMSFRLFWKRCYRVVTTLASGRPHPFILSTHPLLLVIDSSCCVLLG